MVRIPARPVQLCIPENEVAHTLNETMTAKNRTDEDSKVFNFSKVSDFQFVLNWLLLIKSVYGIRKYRRFSHREPSCYSASYISAKCIIRKRTENYVIWQSFDK